LNLEKSWKTEEFLYDILQVRVGDLRPEPGSAPLFTTRRSRAPRPTRIRRTRPVPPTARTSFNNKSREEAGRKSAN
jgi:hypothetical protein